MNREAIARAQRRRQAQEALEFERDREAALRSQLEDQVAELEAPRIDEHAFARMEPGDAEIVRSVLAPESEPPEEEPWLELEASDPEVDEARRREAAEEEIARLEAEIEDCRRRQRAFERYLDALGGDRSAESGSTSG